MTFLLSASLTLSCTISLLVPQEVATQTFAFSFIHQACSALEPLRELLLLLRSLFFLISASLAFLAFRFQPKNDQLREAFSDSYHQLPPPFLVISPNFNSLNCFNVSLQYLSLYFNQNLVFFQNFKIILFVIFSFIYFLISISIHIFSISKISYILNDLGCF